MGRERTILNEPVAFARVVGVLHENDGGQAYVKNYASVNKEPKVDVSDRSRKYFGLRVETHIKEDKNVNMDDDSFYCKDVKTIQRRDNETQYGNGNDSYATNPINTPNQKFNSVGDGKNMDKCDYLKNMHDNHLEDHRTKDKTDKNYLLWILAGCGLVSAIVALVLIATL